MKQKIGNVLLMMVLALLLLSGCGDNGNVKLSGNAGVKGEFIRDSAGREVVVPERLQRVIVLNTATYNMITAIGAAETVIGVSESIKRTETAAAKLEVFGSYMDANVEKIVAAKPDAVIDNKTMRPAQVKQLEDAGIKVVFFEFYLPSILSDEIISLGKFFKREVRAKEYADFIGQYRQLIAMRLQDLKPENKVTVYFEGYSAYSTVAHGTGGDELIFDAGGINIAKQELTKYPKVSSEWVLQKNPQVIVKTVSGNNRVMGSGYTDRNQVKILYDSIISRIGWNELAAVKNKKVLLLAQNIGTTPEGSIIGALFMAKTMYPDRFRDVSPQDVYQELQRKFFGGEKPGIIAYQEEAIFRENKKME